MNEHDTGRLRAYLDGALPPAESRVVTAHLDQCAECAAELNRLQRRAGRIAAGLSDLEPGQPAVEPEQALVRFRARETAGAARMGLVRRAGRWENGMRSLEMMKQKAFTPRWRPAVVALSAVMVVAILFTIAPVREAAADFLGLFRVRKFAVIPLDNNQMQRLEQLARQAEGAFGEPQILREKGPEQAVTDASQASSLAGYSVRSPARLPDGASLERFAVQAGPKMHFEFDRATVETLMSAAGVPVEGLPQTEKIIFDVDVASVTIQQYRLGASRMEFMQLPSPHVDLPEGMNPAALAEAGFLFLGMPAEDARRMANSIDWTSTLVVPLPTDSVRAREVTVDGVTGLLLEDADGNRGNSALVWEKDDILYFLNGRIDERVLMDAADSLQ